MAEPKTVTIRGGLIPISYSWSVGKYMDKYLKGLKDRKILGTRCPSCRRVFVPPRSTCGKCFTQLDDWVEVDDKGTLENFTIAYVRLSGSGDFEDLKEPKVIGMIKYDGASSCVVRPVEVGIDVVRKGMRVKAVWADEPKGKLGDIKYFEPIEGRI